MKALDLNAYGVSEMSRQEMMETDGGIGVLIAALLTWALFGVVAGILGASHKEAKGGDGGTIEVENPDFFL